MRSPVSIHQGGIVGLNWDIDGCDTLGNAIEPEASHLLYPMAGHSRCFPHLRWPRTARLRPLLIFIILTKLGSRIGLCFGWDCMRQSELKSMHLLVKELNGTAFVGAILTLLAALLIFPSAIAYWHNPPSELAPITASILSVQLWVLAGFAGVETALLVLLASKARSQRRTKVLLAGLCGAISLAAILLLSQL